MFLCKQVNVPAVPFGLRENLLAASLAAKTDALDHNRIPVPYWSTHTHTPPLLGMSTHNLFFNPITPHWQHACKLDAPQFNLLVEVECVFAIGLYA